MKKCLPLLLLTVFFSCKKESLSTLKSELTGSWELRYIEDAGIFNPGVPPDVSPGNGNRWTFTGSEYQYYSSGQLSVKGTYKLIKAPEGNTVPADALIFLQDQNVKLRFTIANDTLTLYGSDVGLDGPTTKYIRQ